MSKLDTFNRIAPYYNRLKTFVFGSNIDDSQVAFLRYLPSEGRILILGGGSGEVIKPILQCKPDCEIWFVEASSEMLKKAMSNVPDHKQAVVRLIHSTVEMLPPDLNFDALITNFFLDLFPDHAVLGTAEKLNRQLRGGGTWLVSDFVDGGKLWQRVLLWMMYRFFVVTCGIDARELPAWQTQIRTAGFEEEQSATFYGGFIKSCVFRKKS